MSFKEATALKTWHWAVIAVVAAIVAALSSGWRYYVARPLHDFFYPKGRLSVRGVLLLWMISAVPIYVMFVLSRWLWGRRRRAERPEEPALAIPAGRAA